MWNYSFVLPSLLILVIIQSFYYAWPRLHVRTNAAFQAIVLSDLLVILFDLLSSYADTDYQAYSTAAIYFLNTAYFVLYLVRAHAFFVFTSAILHIPFTLRSTAAVVRASVFLISEIITVSSFATGAVFSIQADGYHKGPLYNIIYFCFIFYILYSVVLLVRHRGNLMKHQYLSGLAAQAILLAGNMIRFLFPTYIVMNMFCLLALFVLFLGFQNPRIYMANIGRAYNLTALREMVEENKGDGGFSIFAFAIKSYADSRLLYGGQQMDDGVTLISRYLTDHYPDKDVYYLGNGGFALTGVNKDDIPGLHHDLMERFSMPWQSAGGDMYLRAGYVHLGPDDMADTTDEILDDLSGAMRESSRSGRPEEDLVDSEFFSSLEEQTEVKRALEEAIQKDAVEVYLMPIVDSHSRKLKYAEALSRIKGKDGRIIPPDLFIPLAERNGQIGGIGLQVLDKVCAFISENHPEDWGMSWINVNVSPVQFLDRNLCSEFLEVLSKHGVKPERIHLEITEQSMQDMQDIQRQIDMMIEAGFRLSLDDYGKGYSNLSRLNSLPFADIKIDMDIVWDYCRKRDILLPSLISTLKKLGFTVTAEGIETEETAALMCEAGCDYLQGYLFSMPVPMRDCIPK